MAEEKGFEATAVPDSGTDHIEQVNTSSLRLLAADPVEYARIVRKIDWRVLPIMWTCYMLSFLDKIVLNYAVIMGLRQELHFGGNQFSNLATIFFLAYAVAELPQGLLFQKYPIAWVLGGNIVLWGVVSACTAATHNYAQILVARIFLGIFEAAITPALTLATSTWYEKRHSAPRYGVWYSGLGFGQIIGGLISFGVQHGAKTGFGGWKLMFVVVGIVNTLFGFVVIWCLPNSIDSATFLSEHEKETLKRVLLLDQAGVGEHVFKRQGIWDAFADVQVWLLSLSTLLILMSSGVITTFSATLIAGFGYDSRQAALLNMPAGAVGIVTIAFATLAIYYGASRWVTFLVVSVPAITGAGLMSFAPAHNKIARLMGIYLYNSLQALMAIVFGWVGANTAGYSKKIAANGLVAVGFALGNIIGKSCILVTLCPMMIVCSCPLTLSRYRSTNLSSTRRAVLCPGEGHHLRRRWTRHGRNGASEATLCLPKQEDASCSRDGAGAGGQRALSRSN